jgi:hypothetical protein
VDLELGAWMAEGDHRLRFLKKPVSLSALYKAMDELISVPMFMDMGHTGAVAGLK